MLEGFYFLFDIFYDVFQIMGFDKKTILRIADDSEATVEGLLLVALTGFIISSLFPDISRGSATAVFFITYFVFCIAVYLLMWVIGERFEFFRFFRAVSYISPLLILFVFKNPYISFLTVIYFVFIVIVILKYITGAYNISLLFVFTILIFGLFLIKSLTYIVNTVIYFNSDAYFLSNAREILPEFDDFVSSNQYIKFRKMKVSPNELADYFSFLLPPCSVNLKKIDYTLYKIYVDNSDEIPAFYILVENIDGGNKIVCHYATEISGKKKVI